MLAIKNGAVSKKEKKICNTKDERTINKKTIYEQKVDMFPPISHRG
jgi:hypothetical protein